MNEDQLAPASPAPAAPATSAGEERRARQRAQQEFRQRTQAREQTIGRGTAWLARWSLRLVLIVLGLIVLGLVIRYTWSIVLPVTLAMIFTTVLQPPAYFLERHLKLPSALAAATVMLGSFSVIGLLIYVMAPSVADQSTQLADDAVKGINRLSDWLAESDLGVSANQLDEMLTSAEEKIKDSAGTIASGVLVGVNMATNIVLNLVLALVLTFLFIKDGRRFLPWIKNNSGPTAGPHLYEVGNRIWATLGGFIRTQALVSAIDAVFIYIGLIAVGVPLAFPLAVITFFAGFIPIIGAVSAGALAVLIALVSVGPLKALIVLAVILAVQQLEGNVLSPLLQSRSMNLHAAVVLLSVTLGSSLFGIIGAFLAVPVTAIVAVILRYLNEQVALNSTDPDPVEEDLQEGDELVNPPDEIPEEAHYPED
ncbi:AI-2E family transporter [Nocardioides sp. Bht2]|uniref:AI-2E family transporter n=1 Tax=Nocardioides sp. Bht2 TaxID=3392297 RepID=UPI0039B37CEB